MFSSTILVGNAAAGAFTPPAGNVTFVQIDEPNESLGNVRRDQTSVAPTLRLMRIKNGVRPANPNDPKSFKTLTRNVVFSQAVQDSPTGAVLVASASLLLTLPEHSSVNAAMVADLIAFIRNFTGSSATQTSLILGES